MQKSEADGYELASDGSRQVKYRIACPSCRSKYVAPEQLLLSEMNSDEEKKSNDRKPPSPINNQLIAGSVLLLREAYDAAKLLKEEDCALSSSNLKKKYEFIQEMTLDDLKDAWYTYQDYLSMIQKETDYEFYWEEDFQLLPRSLPAASSLSAIQRREQKLQTRPWRDPTLFIGLEELMTLQEQEFVTELMCSNDSRSLAQAAHIMHGVLTSMGNERASARAIQDLSAFGTAPPAQQTRQFMPPPPLHPKEMQKIRGRFPLPGHMPRCVIIPVYDVTESKRNHPLRFERSARNVNHGLTLTEVRGVAGRSGLRRGDVVTHINAEPIYNLSDFDQAVLNSFHSSAEGDLMIVVNAHAETAHALRTRAQEMQRAKVQF